MEEKHDAKLKLSQTRYLYDKVIKESAIAMAILNIKGKIINYNDLFSNLFEINKEQFMHINFHDLLMLGGINDYQLIIEQMVNNIIKFSQEKQQWKKENGEIIFMDIKLSLVCDRFNDPIYIIAYISNNTEQVQIQNQLDKMHYYDSLTGLANSNGIYKLAANLASEKFVTNKFILMVANIDNFKNINGSLGYDTGDAILKTVAERMQQSINPGDLAARISGDMFALIIRYINNPDIYQSVIKKITDTIMRPVRIGNQEIIITMSAGISIHPDHGREIKILLKHADLALQHAKISGKNNCQLFSHELSDIMDHDVALRFALNSALLHDEFILHYQPKIDLNSFKVSGVEAFLRWRNTKFGNVSSGEIIKVAIDTGLIIPVGDWVMREACNQIKNWKQVGLHNISIAINCSLREIHQRNFTDKLSTMCNELEISPQLIEIEFKESDIMRDTKFILEILYRLKSRGFTVVIDDYGRGQCSLTNLKRLSLDKIKINTILINQIQEDDMSTSILAAIVENANKIGIKTVATQVEKKEQFDYLLKIGCKEIQGNYIFVPSSHIDVTSYILNEVGNEIIKTT